MPISLEQRLDLYLLARDHWLEAHGTLSAYERDYRKNKVVSARMKMGALVSAIATALSTAAPWPPLTVIASIITAILSAIDQTYSPAKSSQAFWDCRTKLDGIKKDIVSYVIAMESANDFASGVEPLNQIANRLTEGTKVPFDVLPSDRESAQYAFKDSVLSGIISRYEQQPARDGEREPEQDDEKPAALGFDAPDVVAVSRQFRPSGRG